MSRGNQKLTVLCFFPPALYLTSSIKKGRTQLQTEANRLVYEFMWGRYQCANITASGSGEVVGVLSFAFTNKTYMLA